MKLDAALAVEGNNLPGMDHTAAAAEELGFDGLWTSETKHDSFLPLALAANATESLSLGTSIAIAFSRSPMATAQTAWDLQSLSGGRFILGLGTQVRAHVERRFSMPFDKPASRLADYVRALREIWASFQSEGSLDYRGEFYQHTLMSPFFQPRPDRPPRDPDLHRRREYPPRKTRRQALRRLPRPPVPLPGVRKADHKARHIRGS